MEKFLAHWPERLTGKDRGKRQFEEFCESEGQFETGPIVATFQVTDRLIIYADGVSQFLTAQTSFRPKNGDSIVELPADPRIFPFVQHH
jgi:hypothetical protein